MLGYSNQNATYIRGTAAAGLTLTATYAASGGVPIGGMSQAILACYYTPLLAQTNRNLSIKVEFSYDGGTTWVPLSKGSDAAVASNIIITTVYDWEFKMAGAVGNTVYYKRIPVDLGDYGVGVSPQMRVSVKEDGTDTFGTASVILALSGN